MYNDNNNNNSNINSNIKSPAAAPVEAQLPVALIELSVIIRVNSIFNSY